MVRIKQRYLLLDILYPDPSSWPNSIPDNADPETNNHLRIHSPTADTLSPGLLAKLIREQVSELFGDWGVGRLGGSNAGGVSVKYLSPATSTAIIRCPRASYRLVWAAITHLSHVPEYTPGSGYAFGKRAGAMNRPCVFRVVRVSGTMRKAEEEAIRRGRREVARVRGVKEGVVLGGLLGGDGAGDDVGVGVEDVDMDDDADDSE
ncbi:Rpp14/Pop5 family protein [Aspergillus chevalieri]|uniref:Ribonuclease P/MRP protein subunit POP5 n=1 Tax=Aspergillus chevalieri TaxID=182096 RepID=A0A7R7VT53_ASPCH|nr:uncharacterized protein ACHE_60185A [Aspergillus chevalieri]BCR90299.1 hypothetical protein ACHE_60185A [Aspergillus chevalieri]